MFDSRIKKTRILVIVLIVLFSSMLFVTDERLIQMIMFICIISAVLLVATTRIYKIIQVIGFAVMVLIISVFLFEFTMIQFRENCILLTCNALETKYDRSIEQYAKFLQTMYPDEEWAETFSYELSTIIKQPKNQRIQYHPYIQQRFTPYDGQYAYIDEQGLRPIPQSECSDDSYRVFTMGDSTMWGQYEPNDRTLGALIQEEIASTTSQPICLINYAQGAWNSTQSLIQLINLIQQDNIPDLVILYHGFMGLRSTQLFHNPITPSGVSDMIEAISAYEVQLESNEYINLGLAQTETMRLLDETAILLTPKFPNNKPYYLKKSYQSDISPAELFENNYQILTLLSLNYDFDIAMFVQPVAFWGDKQMTPEEEAQKKGWLKNMEDILIETYGELENFSTKYEHMYFLGGVFDSITETVYVDGLHIYPEYNQVVAKTIGEIIIANYLE